MAILRYQNIHSANVVARQTMGQMGFRSATYYFNLKNSYFKHNFESIFYANTPLDWKCGLERHTQASKSQNWVWSCCLQGSLLSQLKQFLILLGLVTRAMVFILGCVRETRSAVHGSHHLGRVGRDPPVPPGSLVQLQEDAEGRSDRAPKVSARFSGQQRPAQENGEADFADWAKSHRGQHVYGIILWDLKVAQVVAHLTSNQVVWS